MGSKSPTSTASRSPSTCCSRRIRSRRRSSAGSAVVRARSPSTRRAADRVDCPKDEALRSILEAHDDDGRLVVFAGFTESVDRVTEVVSTERWEWIRLDGRGWSWSPGIKLTGTVNGRKVKPYVELLHLFQKGQDLYPRVALVGQADSAGTGLTLTASNEIVFYSNSFNGEARMQACHRIHRPGMDLNKRGVHHRPRPPTQRPDDHRQPGHQGEAAGTLTRCVEDWLRGGGVKQTTTCTATSSLARAAVLYREGAGGRA